MGWYGSFPKYFKPNGDVDRLAEVNAKFTGETDDHVVDVVASRMVGSTYYGAVRIRYKNYQPTKVVGMVVLTSKKKDGEFFTKTMDEEMGPLYYQCPKAVLECLTDTLNENAIEWRKKCWQNIRRKEKTPKLEEGTVIKFEFPFESPYYEKGEIVFFQKRQTMKSRTFPGKRKSFVWYDLNDERKFLKQKYILHLDYFNVVPEALAKAELHLRKWRECQYPKYPYYEIVEDSYEYDDGLTLIVYSDPECEDEIDFYCVSISDFDKED